MALRKEKRTKNNLKPLKNYPKQKIIEDKHSSESVYPSTSFLITGAHTDLPTVEETIVHPDISSKITSDTENESFDDSLDKDYSPSDSSTDSDKIEQTSKCKRNKKPQTDQWQMNVSKSKRLKGESHISRRGKIRQVKNMKPRKSAPYKDKRFLEPSKKVINLHETYLKDAEDVGKMAVGFTYFKNMFCKLNLSVFKPKKDQCDLCVSAKMGHVTPTEHQNHLAAKDLAQGEKASDKLRAADDSSVSVWTMDTQGVLFCPNTTASALYYRTKLQVHNFTLHNMTTNNGYCYIWDELEGDLSSEVFTSIQFQHFQTFLKNNPQVKELIIWSDGCSYQNKNNTLANAYLQLSIETGIRIFQKYLVVGKQ
ncbi:hypothetical protein LOTGIDRAFT_154581 [Lottia gigantea]|uniref:Uncharacterized protein n=1 Tax=Lottia gigantea TaxID=225164 RepID=V4A1C4_LOTGI|nr:hypothetical protein LOTGIDRAFT_154581 [Lottia gigantea]ESO87091.1 hypothetical protein LOTGIDRAFT_154581 [Lottia gigantea]